jgi:transcriptional regulator with XRE-family HTH domain
MIQNGSYQMSQKGSSPNSKITPEQLRAARALLGWSQTELAKQAGMSLPTVKRVETEGGPRVSEEARSALQRALTLGGIEFIDENGGGPGVRLRKRRRLKIPK